MMKIGNVRRVNTPAARAGAGELSLPSDGRRVSSSGLLEKMDLGESEITEFIL